MREIEITDRTPRFCCRMHEHDAQRGEEGQGQGKISSSSSVTVLFLRHRRHLPRPGPARATNAHSGLSDNERRTAAAPTKDKNNAHLQVAEFLGGGQKILTTLLL